ncbi:MAG TPA: hypothetical protein VM841_04150 [Actinomycetota bacterium]|nr:hypothetical protein [Actinomycetota bacterium]
MKRIHGMAVAGMVLAIALGLSGAQAHTSPTHGVEGTATITATSVPVWVSIKSAPFPGTGGSGVMRIGPKSYDVTCAYVSSNFAGTVHMLRASGTEMTSPFSPVYLLIHQGPGAILRVRESSTATTLPCGAPSAVPPSPATGSFTWV